MKFTHLVTVLILVLFTTIHGQCDGFLKSQEQCLQKPLSEQEACIDLLNQNYLNCRFQSYSDINLAKECKVGKIFRLKTCTCKFQQICTGKNLCLCYKTLEICPKSFPRSQICTCGKGTKRICKDDKCGCSSPKPKTPLSVTTKLAQCKSDTPYTRGGCLCEHHERCGIKIVQNVLLKKNGKLPAQTPQKGLCVCIKALSTCPTAAFPDSTICKCVDKKHKRFCSKGTCLCKGVKECNKYADFPSKNSCYCKDKFTSTVCKTTNGKKTCQCARLEKKCDDGILSKSGSCFCDLKLNNFTCKKVSKKKYCICKKKEFCDIGIKVKRNSCLCRQIPNIDLEDENSERKRVIRSYGWKKCSLIKKGKKSFTKCKCEALKCHESGRFKKYFCKCPRLTLQYCNKKSNYCKCLSKKPRKSFKGKYRFRRMITTKSNKIASYNYIKAYINVYLEPNMKKQEKRFVFVNHGSGSYYVIKKPTIITKDQIRNEMSLYQKVEQNYPSIQKQLKEAIGNFDKIKK